MSFVGCKVRMVLDLVSRCDISQNLKRLEERPT
jgi:hypothetical protein